MTKLNAQPFQKLDGSRNSWFETLEKGQFLPLPATAFELANWSMAKVNIDYHVAVDHHFYSVPHPLIHQQLDVRLTDHTVELFQRGKRVAAHVRSHQRGQLHHRGGTSAQVPSTLSAMDAQPDRGVGQNHRPGLRPGRRANPGQPAPSRTGLSLLPWASSAWAKPSARTGWKPLAGAPCTSAPVPMSASNPSWKTTWKPNPWRQELPLPSPAHENLRGGPYYH